jgi:ubiquinone biosynthesis protein
MIPPSFEPTPLVDVGERAPVTVRPVGPPSRWRGTVVTVRWGMWLAGVALRALFRRPDSRAAGRRLRSLLESLGGVWIKVGQLLSLRIDLFDVDFCQELAQLQDRADGFSGELARRVVEEDLGRPIEQVFTEFDLQPLAAASIGQVHRARLRDGRLVAVKVRRPYVADSLDRELGLVRFFFAAFERLRIASFMRWRNVRWELEEILREELDYRREASAIQRLHATLNARGMYVPHLHSEYSTPRVLVMEFMSGVLMSDYIITLRADPQRVAAWERENDVDPRRVVRRFSASILQQIVEDNLFHGDLHPGNIVLLRGSRVALLDFGSVGFTDRDYLERFRFFMEAVAEREYERAADIALLMAASLPEIDLAPVRAEIVRELLRWGLRTGVAGLPYQTKSADAVNVAITKVFFKHRISFEWAFLRIRRALATMDATAMHLYPDANYTDITQAYFRHARRRALRKALRPATARRARVGIADNPDLVRQLGDMTELALQIERRRLQAAGTAVSSADRAVLAAAAAGGAMAVAVAIAAIAAMTAQHGPSWLRAATLWISAGLAARAPALDWQIWVAVTIGAVLAARTARTLRVAFPAIRAVEPAGDVD